MVDTVVTYCFMVYLSLDFIPESLLGLFKIMNLGTNQYTAEYMPKVIEDWVAPIQNQTTNITGFIRM